MGTTLRDQDDRLRLYASLAALGIAHEDCVALRRISMTLHRWHELECGDSTPYGSYCLVRGYGDGNTFVYDDDGKPYTEAHHHNGASVQYYPVPDKEKGARKRLAKIMARYPSLRAYVQTDPRGCALYILRADEIPEGADISSCYNRGIAVYK